MTVTKVQNQQTHWYDSV